MSAEQAEQPPNGDERVRAATTRRLLLVLVWWVIVFFYGTMTLNDAPAEGLWDARQPRKGNKPHTVIEDIIGKEPQRDPHLVRVERTSKGISFTEIEAHRVDVPVSPDLRRKVLELVQEEDYLGVLADPFTNPSADRRFVVLTSRWESVNPLHHEIRAGTYISILAGLALAMLGAVCAWYDGRERESPLSSDASEATGRLPFYSSQRFYSNLTVLSVLLVGPAHAGFVAIQGGITTSPVGAISAAIFPFMILQALIASKDETRSRTVWNYAPAGVFFLLHVVAHFYATLTNDEFGRFFLGPALGIWSVVGYLLAFGFGMYSLNTRKAEIAANHGNAVPVA